jgi:hypothetical protein
MLCEIAWCSVIDRIFPSILVLGIHGLHPAALFYQSESCAFLCHFPSCFSNGGEYSSYRNPIYFAVEFNGTPAGWPCFFFNLDTGFPSSQTYT